MFLLVNAGLVSVSTPALFLRALPALVTQNRAQLKYHQTRADDVYGPLVHMALVSYTLSPLSLHLVSLCWERSGHVSGSLAASYSSTCTKIPALGRYCSELVHGPVSSSYDTFLFSCPRVRRARSSLVLKLISCNHQDKAQEQGKKKQEHELLPPHRKRKERRKNGVQNKHSATGRAWESRDPGTIAPRCPALRSADSSLPGQFFEICSKTCALHNPGF